jgi:hypothetical protein
VSIQVSGTCSCGAQFTWISKDEDVAREAVADWRKDHLHAAKRGDDGFQPAGGNTAFTERKSDSTRHELDSEFRPGPYGRGISLKWHQS